MANETGVSLGDVKPWDFPPNWRERYNVTYEYSTDVFVSRSGIEQRRALRNTARKYVEYTALAKGEKLRSLERLMAGWAKNYFITPEHTSGVTPTAPMPIGVTQIRLASIPYWVEVGAFVMMSSAEGVQAFEVGDIDTDTNTVTFTQMSRFNFSLGAKLYPGLVGRLSADTRTSRPTDDVAEVQVSYNVLPGSEVPENPGLPAVTWRGEEVVMMKPNYLSPPQVSFGYEVEAVDYSRGLTELFTPISFSNRTWQAEYLGVTHELAHRLVETFHRAKGRRGTFYMPTWKDDMPLRDPIVAGSFRLRVRGTELAELMADDKVYRNIALFLTDGSTVIFNHVRQIFPVYDERGSDSVVTLGEEWLVNVPLERVLRVSWMPLWRFGSDRLTVTWVTNGVARIVPTMITQEDNTLEDIE